MPDPNNQLREYFDATAPPLEVEKVVGDEVWVPGRSKTPSRKWTAPGWAYGAAAMAVVLVLILGVALLLPGGNENEVVEPTPATVAPDVEIMTDREVVEAGVAAFYSGDGERAAALFELPDRTDEETRQEAAYQAAIDGRLTGLACAEGTPGTRFICRMEYRNALHDTGVGPRGGDENWVHGTEVVVEDGVITVFVFPEDALYNILMGSFLATEGRFEGYEDCAFGPFPESCATIQLENLDEWTEWWGLGWEAETNWVDATLKAWYGGDCLGAHYLAGVIFYVDGVLVENGYQDGADALCPSSASSSQTIAYESIMAAEVTVEACEGDSGAGSGWSLPNIPRGVSATVSNKSCTVHYSNAMNTAVGKSPSVTVRDFEIWREPGIVTSHSDDPMPQELWYQGVYPEDTELRESFRLFAEGGELQEEYAAANCANQRTPDCAHLIMDNLDDWAAWYQANSG